MPYAYYIAEEYSVVIIRPFGRFDETEFMDALRVVYGHPRRTSEFTNVWDTRSIEELTMDTPVISMYKSFLQENADGVTEGRVAIIASRSTIRLFSSMLKGINEQRVRQQVHLVQTPEAAADWLEIPEEVLSDVPDEEWMRP